jgi:hypothetical protein
MELMSQASGNGMTADSGIPSTKGTPMRLILELDEEVAKLLRQYVWQINRELQDCWTEETLAASFLAHVLLDSAAAEVQTN